MRKLLIGNVALVAAVIGVAACETKNNARAKAPVAQTAGGVIQKAADVNPAGAGALSVPSEPGALETTPKPRFTLVLGEGKGGFKFRSKLLSDEAKAMINGMFAAEGEEGGLKNELKDAHFAIEGYTDNLGSKTVNEQYGRARANAVKEYLSEQYGITEDRIGVVSYGMDNPVADNSTPEGRAQNRRVIIKVVD